MADDSILRSQHSNESIGRASAPGGQNDPLAELARLIGQNDPFADFGRDSIQREARNPPAPDWRAEQDAQGSSPDVRAYGKEHAGSEGYHDDAGQEGQGSHAYADDETHGQREEIYDDPPRARRRGGLITVTAVVALAVLGTAGAFGYRAISANSGPGTPPPVIRADTAPNKIVPAVQSGEQQSNKLIQDRVGSQGERVVSREEQPIEMREAARPARGGFPPASSPGSTASIPWPSPPPALLPAAQASAAANEPKKIRTVTIRPDQPEPTARPAAAAPAPARSASAAPTETPVPSPTRPAAAGRSGPLSLNPQTAPAPQTAAPQAAVPEPAAPQRPVRTALAPNPPAQAAGGSYVQVSSQRSETDAQASFKALQGKYPAVLGGKQAVIRRADLGDKGTYFRAMVGPFASVEQATELCSSLKAAGGQCVVQRN